MKSRMNVDWSWMTATDTTSPWLASVSLKTAKTSSATLTVLPPDFLVMLTVSEGWPLVRA